jgi:hypothetical protein
MIVYTYKYIKIFRNNNSFNNLRKYLIKTLGQNFTNIGL